MSANTTKPSIDDILFFPFITRYASQIFPNWYPPSFGLTSIRAAKLSAPDVCLRMRGIGCEAHYRYRLSSVFYLCASIASAQVAGQIPLGVAVTQMDAIVAGWSAKKHLRNKNVAILMEQLRIRDDELVLPGATKEALKALPSFEYARK